MLSTVPLDSELARMKDLFRAQRNFYISGFSRTFSDLCVKRKGVEETFIVFTLQVIYRLLNLLVEKADLVDQLKKRK